MVLAALIVVGTLGYSYLEGWPIIDSLYMTMVILSTVGLGTNRELHEPGKLFTIVLITFGAVTGGWAVNAIGHRILENQLGNYFGRRKMEKETKKLQGHYIVCGAGRVGRRVIKEFQLTGVPFVVVEKDPALAERLSSEGALTIVGDAADLEDFQGKHRMQMATDIDDQPVFLAKSAWETGYVGERYPKVRFDRSKERA